MARVAEYKSEITASWIYGDKETKIEPSSITYILCNYYYDYANKQYILITKTQEAEIKLALGF